jgi:hypothetical protein
MGRACILTEGALPFAGQSNISQKGIQNPPAMAFGRLAAAKALERPFDIRRQITGRPSNQLEKKG